MTMRKLNKRMKILKRKTFISNMIVQFSVKQQVLLELEVLVDCWKFVSKSIKSEI